MGDLDGKHFKERQVSSQETAAAWEYELPLLEQQQLKSQQSVPFTDTQDTDWSQFDPTEIIHAFNYTARQ